jgi:hypothetical protein
MKILAIKFLGCLKGGAWHYWHSTRQSGAPANSKTSNESQTCCVQIKADCDSYLIYIVEVSIHKQFQVKDREHSIYTDENIHNVPLPGVWGVNGAPGVIGLNAIGDGVPA